MHAHLKAMLDEIKATAARSIKDSTQITSTLSLSITTRKNGSGKQSTSVAAATEQFSQSVHEVAGLAALNAAPDPAASQQRVMAARKSMNASVETTNRVVRSVRESSKSISDLEQLISKIGTVTMTIREIAEQTNLLATATQQSRRRGQGTKGRLCCRC